MADGDYERAQQLIRQINALRAENAQLEAELEMAEHNVQVLTGNVGVLEGNVHATMSGLADRVGDVDEDISFLFNALREVTEQYFIFKNLSTASKNLTMYTDEYYTKFSFYNKLRRITLGYVIGLDNAIISDESLRKQVEKAYLQNTEYWLAYAIMAVMLWAQNEREASGRALNKALAMDYHRSCVFFLLVNLRFERQQTAREWYLNYLEKIDPSRLGDEFQYLLQSYLNGLFGNDKEFESIVSENMKRMMEQAEATSVGFSEKFVEGTFNYAQTHLHRTEETFPTLNEVCADCKKLVQLLSDAEKHGEFAAAYIRLAEEPEDLAEEQAQRVENVLYGLINGYDDAEWRVVKEQKRNEAVIEAKGDMKAANEKFELLYAHLNEKKPLSDLMVTWAFSEDPTQTNNTVKRFTISMMKDKIYRGYEKFAENYRKQEPERVKVTIGECSMMVKEDEQEAAAQELDKYYNKNRRKHVSGDKQVKIYGVVCIAAILILVIMAFSFSPVALTIGVLAGVLGGFLLWRRIVDVRKLLDEKKRLAQVQLSQALEELECWRKCYHAADAHLSDVKDALERY